MSELIRKLKEADKKNIYLIAGVAVIAVALLLSSILPSEDERNITVTNTGAYSSQYIKTAEKELESLLEKIQGAGKVQVLLTLESCYENVYAKAYEQTDKQNKDSENGTFKEQYVIVKQGSNNEECLVIKVYEPVIKGVAIVCEGGDNTAVKKAITETVCAVYDISSAKVSVVKMN